MDTATFLLGILPPSIAILAEILNPISKENIKREYDVRARQFVPDPDNPDEEAKDEEAKTPEEKLKNEEKLKKARAEFEKGVEEVSKAVANTASATAEVSTIIPTLISVTAGITAILINDIDPKIGAVLLIMWITVSLLGVNKYFATINYYNLAFFRKKIPQLPEVKIPFYGKTPLIPRDPMIEGDKFIQRILISVNLGVIAFVVIWAWIYGMGEAKPVISEQQAADIRELESNIRELKSEIRELKSDIPGPKSDTPGPKSLLVGGRPDAWYTVSPNSPEQQVLDDLKLKILAMSVPLYGVPKERLRGIATRHH